MPSVSNKIKNEEEIVKAKSAQETEIEELKKKNAELDNKLDLILQMLQSQNSVDTTKETEPNSNDYNYDDDSDNEYTEPLPNKNIRVMSLCYGSLNLSDGSHVALHFDNFGQIKSCLYSKLIDIVNTDARFAEEGMFYICDPNAVYHLGLHESYKKIFDYDTIMNICNYSENEVTRIVSDMNENQKKILSQIIVTRMAKGDKFDLNKVKIISNLTGININQELDTYQAMQKFLNK